MSCYTVGCTRSITVEEAIKRVGVIGHGDVKTYTGAPHVWFNDCPGGRASSVKNLHPVME